MDCILLRDWINRRITESQSRHINWFGMYTVNNIGTCTSYPSLLQRLGFTLFYDPIQEVASYIGFRIFAPLRKWTFGAGYNHQAVVFQPFFLLGPLHVITLICVSWVGTHIRANLKLLSGHKNIKINIAGLFQSGLR